MADPIQAKTDFSGALAGLDRLKGAARESLARSMAVAGGQVLRDEAKLLAPVESGKLRKAIYLAYKQNKSSSRQQVYSVSWNASHLDGASRERLDAEDALEQLRATRSLESGQTHDLPAPDLEVDAVDVAVADPGQP